ncbi:hypothetical protein D915_009616 [Fasciola hepatica]|uniref:Uncharacterized protein n=1 Tax=Fasciola hepatica TaxID=6192 RepID=A0A4E0QZ73_FASHE|nr:hypothetical protein D915_009616 [Fasciola hepatica]
MLRLIHLGCMGLTFYRFFKNEFFGATWSSPRLQFSVQMKRTRHRSVFPLNEAPLPFPDPFLLITYEEPEPKKVISIASRFTELETCLDSWFIDCFPYCGFSVLVLLKVFTKIINVIHIMNIDSGLQVVQRLSSFV